MITRYLFLHYVHKALLLTPKEFSSVKVDKTIILLKTNNTLKVDFMNMYLWD